MKVLELFGGIGAPRKALERLGIKHEVVDYVEIDKFAVKSYNAMYGTNYEPQDITVWDKDLDVDLIFHGSPCQDFSLAGKQAGGEIDSGTRSSLMWETVRIITKLKPKYVIWENVKNVISKKHKHNFDMYLARLEELGYRNYCQVLNAKDYGIPQNRERVFVVSVRNDVEQHFEFPQKQELKLRLKDMLESEVDEKYYLSNEYVERLLSTTFNQGKYENRVQKEICGTLLARDYKDPKLVVADFRYDEGLRIRKNNMCPCLTTNVGNSGLSSNPLLIKEATNDLGAVEMVGLFDHTSSDNFAKGKRDYGFKDEYGTLKCTPKYGIYKSTDLRIRKITPREAFRLMGFDDSDFEKASQVNSNTQLYKQAGNSIVVNVLEAIFTNLLTERSD